LPKGAVVLEIRRCEVCREIILEGTELYRRDRRSGELVDDGYDGEYDEGAGECEVCGRELCACCGGIVDGVCRKCREKEEGVINEE
jgi:hypothetical protein